MKFKQFALLEYKYPLNSGTFMHFYEVDDIHKMPHYYPLRRPLEIYMCDLEKLVEDLIHGTI